VRVGCREVEAGHRVTLEVDLHENGGFVTEYAGVVTWIDHDRLGRYERPRAPIGILHEHLTLHEKSHVCMHAQRRADSRSEVDTRPA